MPRRQAIYAHPRPVSALRRRPRSPCRLTPVLSSAEALPRTMTTSPPREIRWLCKPMHVRRAAHPSGSRRKQRPPEAASPLPLPRASRAAAVTGYDGGGHRTCGRWRPCQGPTTSWPTCRQATDPVSPREPDPVGPTRARSGGPARARSDQGRASGADGTAASWPPVLPLQRRRLPQAPATRPVRLRAPHPRRSRLPARAIESFRSRPPRGCSDLRTRDTGHQP